MKEVSRRDFLKMGVSLAALMGLETLHSEALAQGLQELYGGRHRVIWLQGQGCTGCSVSFLNSHDPSPATILTQSISLVFHPTIGAAQGELAIETLQKNLQKPGYILIIEGAIPMDMPYACIFGERPLEETLVPAIRNAKLVIAVGTCAAFGGMPAAQGNPTGAASVEKFMKARRFKTDNLIVLPTCPTHPESVVGTLVYALKFGMPELDSHHRPKVFYGRSVHDECPRYHYYQNQVFASSFGDEHACLFKLGCLGPLSYANCSRRQWNNGVNWCIRANAPCLACSSEYFCRDKDLAFYRKGERHKVARES